MTESRPDIVILVTDEERAPPPYETEELRAWRRRHLPGRRWFDDHGVSFAGHYTGSLACVPSRPTMFTGHYPDVHGVTQTDGIGKTADDSGMRWLRAGEVPTLGHWLQESGYDTHYDGKWHISHADIVDPATGRPLATNDDAGLVDPEAVAVYRAADRLREFGFSGWVGPEPHGAGLANSGYVRDPLIAARVLAWLEDRYARRRAGDAAARRPFLLVASFVNPHDIVLWPAWADDPPVGPSPADPPAVPAPPTADEDLADKPSVQRVYRDSYPTGYGPAEAITARYTDDSQAYRDFYHRLHAEVDGPLDEVRSMVVDGSDEAVLIRTSDHGELLGAHGGLHQKWYTLYDEATRVPFVVARTGARSTTPRVVDDMVTSHVDLVPTVLSAAGVDVDVVAARLAERFTEVHALPGRDLLPVVEGGVTDPERPVYLATRDHILDGDDGISLAARVFGMEPPIDERFLIQVPAGVPTAFEGIVARVDGGIDGGAGHVWKLVRSYDDPTTWTTPDVEHRVGASVRTAPVEDEWELYDMDVDPIERDNRASDPSVATLADHLRAALESERRRCVPARNRMWPYPARRSS